MIHTITTAAAVTNNQQNGLGMTDSPFVHVEEPPVTESRRKTAFVASGASLLTSAAGFAVAVVAYETTENIKAGAFWAQITVVLSSILCLAGLFQKWNGRSTMMGGLVVGGFGSFFTFIGICVDGVQAAHVHNTDFKSCSYALLTARATCTGSSTFSTPCYMNVPARSCYCCYLYREDGCDMWGVSGKPSYYSGIDSCSVVSEYFGFMLWSSMALCIGSLISSVFMVFYVNCYRMRVQQVQPAIITAPPATAGYGPPIVIFSSHTVGYYPPNGISPVVDATNTAVVGTPVSVQPSTTGTDGNRHRSSDNINLPPPPPYYRDKPPPYSPRV